MPFRPSALLTAPTTILRWLAVAGCVGILAGAASALFLASLDWATATREAHPWLIAMLPVAGLLIGLAYHRWGAQVEAGSNLVLDEIHEPANLLPLRMTPMILLGTVATHLFGGSAGREGTAVQMGASLADRLTPVFRLDRQQRRLLLMAGISAGFSSVFGTPLAGMIFGMEVLAAGAMRFEAIFPCLVAALVGDHITVALGCHHTAYAVALVPALDLEGLVTAAAAGCVFGLAALAFTTLTHAVTAWAKRAIGWPPLRLVVGGAIVALAVLALGSQRHIGLGIPTIVASFGQASPPQDFALKILLTAVTLGFGFKGGEVTPLFFIGATLGSTLAWILPLPVDVLAGMGFVAVFAGAANTPLTCIVMAIELFGAPMGVYAAIACVAAYLCSGHTGIYRSQRIGQAKSLAGLDAPVAAAVMPAGSVPPA